MSAATVIANEAVPKSAGKKKLIIIAAVLVLVLGGGGAAVMMMKKKAAADADGEDGAETAQVAEPAHKADHKKPPIFVPLDPFTVNLADREAERYAQVGVTLEIEDAKVGEELKLYLPAIRNNILMLLAHKTAGELLTRDGKLKLAREIRREALQPLGYSVPDEDEEAADEDDHGKKKPKKSKKKKAAVSYPIKAVHFANIIIQ